MRALYLPQAPDENTFIVKDDQYHHLKNVLRVKVGDELLGLNGVGGVYSLVVSQIANREIILDILCFEEKVLEDEVHLGIGLLKKDALAQVVKQVCELGISKIFLLESEYAQSYKINIERLNKLLIAGIEQSNFAFLPEIESVKLKDLNYADYESIFIFSLKDSNSKPYQINSKKLMLIGPEGGFSEKEESWLAAINKTQFIHFPTPIMRAPTALSCARGYLLKPLFD